MSYVLILDNAASLCMSMQTRRLRSLFGSRVAGVQHRLHQLEAIMQVALLRTAQYARPPFPPRQPGQMDCYEERDDGWWYCRLCRSYVTDGHIGSDKHIFRAQCHADGKWPMLPGPPPPPATFDGLPGPPPPPVEVDDHREGVDVHSAGVDELTTTVRELTSTVQKLTDEVDELTTTVKELTSTMQKLTDQVDGLQTAFKIWGAQQSWTSWSETSSSDAAWSHMAAAAERDAVPTPTLQ